MPAAGVVLLVLWNVWDFSVSSQHMSSWAALLLFGGFGLSAAAPRVGVIACYAAFLLQLIRPECRFGSVGWVAYGAVCLISIVLAAIAREERRRRTLVAVLPLGLLIGLFTNLPGLEASDLHLGGDFPPFGLVNGKSWQVEGFSSWSGLVGSGQLELLVGLLVWTAGSGLLIMAGWTMGSSYRARRLQWAAEAAAAVARDDLRRSRRDLAMVEGQDRVVQDVHDLTAHSLSVILAQADGASAHSPDPGSRAALASIAGNARTALVEIRTLLERLDQQPDGDTSTVADIGALVEQVEHAGRTVDYREQGTPAALPASSQLAAYRIVQEALTNALRHGVDTAPIRVLLHWQPDGLAIVVTSPTRDADPVASSSGRGVPGMEQRARFAGGWLTAGSEAGEYLVTAYLPALPASAS